MTISKGAPWGENRPLPKDSAIVDNDAELARLIYTGVLANSPAVVGLAGGDVWATIGGESGRSRRESELNGPFSHRVHSHLAWTFPIDLGLVRIDDGAATPFINAVLGWTGPDLRRIGLGGPREGFAVLNGQVVRSWRLGHRGHLNDGLLDLTLWDLRVGELRSVDRRARMGAHTPHPRIVERKASTHVVDLGSTLALEIDGQRTRGRHLEFSIVADAGFVVL